MFVEKYYLWLDIYNSSEEAKEFDEKKNQEYSSGIGFLNKDGSKVKIIVLPTNEELSIARETKELTTK